MEYFVKKCIKLNYYNPKNYPEHFFTPDFSEELFKIMIDSNYAHPPDHYFTLLLKICQTRKNKSVVEIDDLIKIIKLHSYDNEFWSIINCILQLNPELISTTYYGLLPIHYVIENNILCTYQNTARFVAFIKQNNMTELRLTPNIAAKIDLNTLRALIDAGFDPTQKLIVTNDIDLTCDCDRKLKVCNKDGFGFDGLRLLHVCNINTVEFLLNYYETNHKNIEPEDETGCTPFFRYLYHDMTPYNSFDQHIIQKYLQMGANPYHKNNYHIDVFEHAEQKGLDSIKIKQMKDFVDQIVKKQKPKITVNIDF